MRFYTVRVRERTCYLDERGLASFFPVPMPKWTAKKIASRAGAFVQIWRAELETEYDLPSPVLPDLEVR
jgi:hypothetical protein